MSTDSYPAAPAGSAGRRAISPITVFLLLGTLAFGGWLILRVRGALQNRSGLAVEREQHAARSAAEAAARPKVTVTHGLAERWQPTVPVEGTLLPAREADLGFKVPGRLAAIRVRLGHRVGEGAILANLDTVEAAAQLQAVEAQVRAAGVQLELAEDAAKRTGALVETGAAPKATGFQVGQQKSLATAQLDGAKAQAALARANLANQSLVAPFGGVVTKVPSGPGGIVNPGVPLFHLQDTATLRLTGSVSETDRGLFKVGDPVAVETAEGSAQGQVSAVLPSVDPLTRRVVLEAQIKNDQTPALLAGTFVRAMVKSGTTIPVVRLPGTTLRPGTQDELFVLDGEKLARRKIVFATAADGALLVRRGVSAADQVVDRPAVDATEGDLVDVERPAAAPAAK